MPSSSQDTLERAFALWHQRFNQRRAARVYAYTLAVWCVCAAVYAGLNMYSAAVTSQLPFPVWIPAIAALLVALVGATWWSRRSMLSRLDCAQVMDIKLDSKSLFSTSEQILAKGGELSSSERLCLEEAAESLRRDARDTSISWSLGLRAFVFPIAVASVITLPMLPYAEPAAAPQETSTAQLAPAADILEKASSPKKDPKAPSLPSTHPIQRELKTLARRLTRKELSPRQAREEISALKRRIRATQKTLESSGRRTRRAAGQASRPLTKSPSTSELGRALSRASRAKKSAQERRQDAQTVSRALKKLRKKSPEDRGTSAQALRRASQNASQASSPELADAFDRAAKALEQNNAAALDEAARDLERALQQGSEEHEALDEVSRALEQAGKRLSGQPAQGTPQEGREEGPSSSLPRLHPRGKPGEAGEDGAGAGRGHSDTETDGYEVKPTHQNMDRFSDVEPEKKGAEYKELYESVLLDDASRSLTHVRGKKTDQKGPPAGVLRGGTQNPQAGRERARRVLEALPSGYSKDARDAMDREEIPPAYRDSVRDYFDPQK